MKEETFWNPLVPELTVRDLSASLAFYRLLGFSVRFSREDPPFAYLELGQAQLMIEQGGMNKSGDAWHVGALEYPFGRGLNLQIEVPDVRLIAATLRRNSLPLFRELRESWYAVSDQEEEGQREFLVQDPDGYLLRFAEPLGARNCG